MLGRIHKYIKAVDVWHNHYKLYKAMCRDFSSMLNKLGIENSKAPGEEEYIAFWKQLYYRVEPYSYRLYRQYVGDSPYIVPEDIGHAVIERILNPLEHRATYADKNLFPVLIGKENVVKTVACRMGGVLLDSDYHLLSKRAFDEILQQQNSLILKPSVRSNSGKGVRKFTNQKGLFIDSDEGFSLTYDYLNNYKGEFVLQEALEQSDFMNHFCSTAVNTLRITVYKSIDDNEPRIIGSVMRIGRNGAIVDNGHAGGRFVGINIQNGHLANKVMDQYGFSDNSWNGISFTDSNYSIPNWDKVLTFAKYCASRIHHHRLIALDITLDRNNNPVLIEYNIDGFSYWLFMFSGALPFGDYTDEIIDYCIHAKNK